MDEEAFIVDGFVFASRAEAQQAEKEKKNIDIIRQKATHLTEQELYELYEKLIERRMFATIIGYSYLYELRRHLVEDLSFEEQKVTAIAIPKQMEYAKVQDGNQTVLKNKIENLTVLKTRMTIVIVCLIFLIAVMFVIAAVNPNAAYLNTENKVLNKYASWQEELEQKEEELDQREAKIQKAEESAK